MTELTAIPDHLLAAQIVQGKKELYEEIVRRYNQRLYRIARAIVKDDHAAEDVMQEAYIRAYNRLDSFEGKSGFATWLTRILINEAIAWLRKNKKMTYMENEAFPDMQEHSQNSPEKKLLNRELSALLENAIDSLPPRYRMVYVMREVEGLSIAETVDCLQLTESNVKVRLNRAKSMLREKLVSYYQPSEAYAFHLTRCNRIASRVMKQIMQA
jgi:RNA polymerase sigma factor (sigma-70 family)